MDDDDVLLTTEDEQVFGHEFNVRERCQQIGITMDNVRHRVGIDRFKWLALMAMIRLQRDRGMFDDVSMESFFERVLPRIPRAERKNPLACVLVFYVGIDDRIQFQVDDAKWNYIQKEVYPNEETLFQSHGVQPMDLVRYVRLFQSTFSP